MATEPGNSWVAPITGSIPYAPASWEFLKRRGVIWLDADCFQAHSSAGHATLAGEVAYTVSTATERGTGAGSFAGGQTPQPTTAGSTSSPILELASSYPSAVSR